MRHLAALRDPLYSSGGMWAFGDELLAWNIFVLFMVPTFFLLWLMRQYESTFASYSRVVFWFSVTAPLSLAICFLGTYPRLQPVTDWFLMRIWRAPFVLIVMALSRVMARSDGAKRLMSRALLIESGTFAIFFALLVSGH